MKPQSKSIAFIHKDSCVACGCCLKICPRQALDIWKGSYAIVSHDLCVGCGKCLSVCPGNLLKKGEDGKVHIRNIRDCWGCPASVIEIVPRHAAVQDSSNIHVTFASPEKGGARHEQ